MPDPLLVLPYELCTLCISIAIDGQESGPLEFLQVSKQWDSLLFNSPSLWSQLYVQNGEDEMARISLFLHLSKGCFLYVDIMTVLPSIASLQLIGEHISRVTTISIRPGASDNVASFPAEEWKRAASNIMFNLFNGRPPPNAEDTSCSVIGLWEIAQKDYRIILMQFTTTNVVANVDEQDGIVSANLPDTETCFSRWEAYIARCIRVFADPAAAVNSIGNMASSARHQDAIRIAIPSFPKLLKDTNPSIRSATIDGLHRCTIHVKLREALQVAIPSLIELLEHSDTGLRVAAVSLLEKLAMHDDAYETLVAIPLLVELLGHWDFKVRSAAISGLNNLAKHEEFYEALRGVIPSLVLLLEHRNPSIGLAALCVVENLAKNDEFHEALIVTIPSLVELLHYRDDRTQALTLSVLESLAKHGQVYETLGVAIPSLVLLLEHRNSSIRLAALSVFGNLAAHVRPCEALAAAIPSLVKLPGHWVFRVRWAAVSVLENIAKHKKFHESLRVSIPSLVLLHEHRSSSIRSAAATVLERLAKHDELKYRGKCGDVFTRCSGLPFQPSLISGSGGLKGGMSYLDRASEHTNQPEAHELRSDRKLVLYLLKAMAKRAEAIPIPSKPLL